MSMFRVRTIGPNDPISLVVIINRFLTEAGRPKLMLIEATEHGALVNTPSEEVSEFMNELGAAAQIYATGGIIIEAHDAGVELIPGLQSSGPGAERDIMIGKCSK